MSLNEFQISMKFRKLFPMQKISIFLLYDTGAFKAFLIFLFTKLEVLNPLIILSKT